MTDVETQKLIEQGKCPKFVTPPGMFGSFQSYRCGKPIKRDGLCGIHASAKERAKKKSAEFEEKMVANVAERAHLDSVVADLNAILGDGEFAPFRREMSKVVVSKDDADTLLKIIKSMADTDGWED